MLPRLNASKFVSTWLTVTLAASIFAVLDGGWLAGWTAFAPSRIWSGELWRLVTWFLVERSPFQLIVTCVCIYKFGGELAPRWGDRRLRRFIFEILAGAAVATSLLALVLDGVWYSRHLGGFAVGDALIIAWARQYPTRIVALYGLVQLSGQRLITVTIAITAVFALFHGPFAWAIELIVCAAAYWYPDDMLARRP